MRILILSILSVAIFSSCGAKDAATDNANIQRGNMMIRQIHTYTAELGLTPPALDAILEAKLDSGEKLLDRATYETLLYIDPVTDKAVEWIYDQDADSSSTPMLTAPEPHKGKRVVLFYDGSAQVMDEGAFQEKYFPG